MLILPEQIVLDVNGDYLVAGGGFQGLRRVTPGGKVSTSRWIEPDLNGMGFSNFPRVLAVDKNGQVYFASDGLIYQLRDVVYVADADRIVKIEAGVMKTVVTLAGKVKWAERIAVDSFGNIAVDRGQDVWVLHPDGEVLIKVANEDIRSMTLPARSSNNFLPSGLPLMLPATCTLAGHDIVCLARDGAAGLSECE